MTKTKGMNFFVYLIALIAGLSGFAFGFDSSLIADVKDKIISQLVLSDWQWSQVVSASLLGCLVGIPISGFFANKVSGRFLLKFTAVSFILGAVFCATANSLNALLVGRFIIGISVGVGAYIAPLFISEIAPPERRGTLILMNGLSITFGQAIAYLVGYLIHDTSPESWRYLFFISCFPAIVLFFGMLFVPHSPRWLFKKHGFDHAFKCLNRIRPIDYDIQKELDEMSIHKSHASASYRTLFKKPIISVLLVGIALGIFQQGSGINAVMYYGPVIFESAGFTPVKNAILATFLIGFINFIFTIFTMISIDKLGRRRLLLSGTLIASLCLFIISFLFGQPFSEQKNWILMLFCIYVTGYCISVGSLFWVIISEIFPLSVRGMAMSIATVMQCAANFIVSLSFLTLYNTFGEMPTFFFFGSVCALAYLFVFYFIPETNGVSLEKIEDNLFKGKKIRDIGQQLSSEHLKKNVLTNS